MNNGKTKVSMHTVRNISITALVEITVTFFLSALYVLVRILHMVYHVYIYVYTYM
jgi:hypothetical protein